MIGHSIGPSIPVDPDGFTYTFGAMLPACVSPYKRLIVLDQYLRPQVASNFGRLYKSGKQLSTPPEKRTVYIGIRNELFRGAWYLTTSAHLTKEGMMEDAEALFGTSSYQTITIEIEIQ